ncbi:hypothetical protein B0H16DRAFT_1553343 [Mycena metata]|uniref:Uncharacterized protein n=1 Tax=Mycena metata TaxID=1033252 RepID=A0AAD7N7A8_9AGAR|nr:hypothetical protein B0H16DRAFT_1553343 [Mycena metata]
MDSSFMTSRTSLSGSSLYTTTSSSTQWGPGAVAGKAIRAMGKAVVRGAEYVVISRRLSGIKAVMPCSDNELAQRPNVDQMFVDLLELSRPRLYPEAFRTQAMQILLAQIGSQQTHYLGTCIATWEADHEELVALLSEIIGIILFPKRGFLNQRLAASYIGALPSDCHHWMPCISFMSGVAGQNDATFHAVLDARFLEVILWVSGAQIYHRKIDPALENECIRAFKVLSEPPSHDLSVLWVEQLLNLSADNSIVSLAEAVHSITVQRLWPTIECRLLEMHVGAMLNTMHNAEAHLFENALREGNYNGPPRFHLVSFNMTFSLSAGFMRNYLRCVGLGAGPDVLHRTVNYLSGLAYPKRIITLSRIIHHLIAQSYIDGSHGVNLSTSLFKPQHPDMAHNIVQFLVRIGVSSQVPLAEEALLDATLLTISPFLAAPWDSRKVHGNIYRHMAWPRVLGGARSLSTYSDHTSDLLKAIRTSGLWTVVDESSRTRSWVHFLQPLF